MGDEISLLAREVERFGQTMIKVKVAMRGQLTDQENEDLDLAAALGNRWVMNKLRIAMGRPPVGDDE